MKKCQNGFNFVDLPIDLQDKILLATCSPPGEGGVDVQLATLREVSRSFRAMADDLGATQRRQVLTRSSREDRIEAASMDGEAFRRATRLATTRAAPRVHLAEPFATAPLREGWSASDSHISFNPRMMVSGPPLSHGLILCPQGRLERPRGWKISAASAVRVQDFALPGNWGGESQAEPTCQMGPGFALQVVNAGSEVASGEVYRIFDTLTGRQAGRHLEANPQSFVVTRGSDHRRILLHRQLWSEGRHSCLVAIWGLDREWTPLPGLALVPNADMGHSSFAIRVDATRDQLVGLFDRQPIPPEAQRLGEAALYTVDLAGIEDEPSRGWSRLSALGPSEQHLYAPVARDSEHFVVSAGRAASLVFELDANGRGLRELVLAWDLATGAMVYEQAVRPNSWFNVSLSLNGGLLAVAYDQGPVPAREKRLRLVNLDAGVAAGLLWDMPVFGPEGILPEAWPTFPRLTSSFGRLWLTDGKERLVCLDAGEGPDGDSRDPRRLA